MELTATHATVSTPKAASGQTVQAIGRVTKKTVQTSAEAGIDAPKSAHGTAAPGLTPGAIPESVVQAQLVQLTGGQDIGTGKATVTSREAIVAFEFNSPAIRTETLPPAKPNGRVTQN
ncbi:MAG: hypothetical protein AB3N11_05245 [Arenibacterium sp.]